MAKAYDYRHVVTFEETNLIGNVYYVHYIRWQGICRERFLAEHAPEVVADLGQGLVLSTVRCSCRYGRELFALDKVIVRMRLEKAAWNRMVLQFEYLREKDGGETEQVALGEQEIACMRREGDRAVETEIPAPLLEALSAYRA